MYVPRNSQERAAHTALARGVSATSVTEVGAEAKGRLGAGEREGKRVAGGRAKGESFVSLSTKEPHLACSLSVTVPAAVVRNVVAAVADGHGAWCWRRRRRRRC